MGWQRRNYVMLSQRRSKTNAKSSPSRPAEVKFYGPSIAQLRASIVSDVCPKRHNNGCRNHQKFNTMAPKSEAKLMKNQGCVAEVPRDGAMVVEVL